MEEMTEHIPMLDWRGIYDKYMQDGSCDLPSPFDIGSNDTVQIMKMSSLVLGDVKCIPLEYDYANDFNAYVEYCRTGDPGNMGTNALDMLWFLTYLTGNIEYAVQVMDIGKKTTIPEVQGAAQWSYRSHYVKPEEYNIPPLPSWD